jgi:hypothetical protein
MELDKKEQARSYYQRAQNTGSAIAGLLIEAIQSELILAPPTVQMLVGVSQCVASVVTETSHALAMDEEISDEDLVEWSDELDVATSLIAVFQDQISVIHRIDAIMAQYKSGDKEE